MKLNRPAPYMFHQGPSFAQSAGLLFRDFAEENDEEIPSPVDAREKDDLPEQLLYLLRVLRCFSAERFSRPHKDPESFRDIDLDSRRQMASHGSIGGDLFLPEDFREMFQKEFPRGSLALQELGKGTPLKRPEHVLVRGLDRTAPCDRRRCRWSFLHESGQGLRGRLLDEGDERRAQAFFPA